MAYSPLKNGSSPGSSLALPKRGSRRMFMFGPADRDAVGEFTQGNRIYLYRWCGVKHMNVWPCFVGRGKKMTITKKIVLANVLKGASPAIRTLTITSNSSQLAEAPLTTHHQKRAHLCRNDPPLLSPCWTIKTWGHVHWADEDGRASLRSEAHGSNSSVCLHQIRILGEFHTRNRTWACIAIIAARVHPWYFFLEGEAAKKWVHTITDRSRVVAIRKKLRAGSGAALVVREGRLWRGCWLSGTCSSNVSGGCVPLPLAMLAWIGFFGCCFFCVCRQTRAAWAESNNIKSKR